MTFIAIATYGSQRAEIATDTSCYSPNARTLSRSSKVRAIPYLDAAIVTQGDHTFGALAAVNTELTAGDCADYDALLAQMPDVGRQLVADLGKPPRQATLFLVGYSPARGRFEAYLFAAEHDWQPTEIDGMFVHPSPTSVRPSDLELGRMPRAHPSDLKVLRSRPAPTKPASREDWRGLAIAAREQRSLAPVETGLKTLVLGQVWHTTVRRGAIHTDRIHEFDDSGDEFRTIVAGTAHPQSQLSPCPCGSGQSLVECHWTKNAPEPCLCGSGKTFGECCSVLAEPEVAALLNP